MHESDIIGLDDLIDREIEASLLATNGDNSCFNPSRPLMTSPAWLRNALSGS
jgi:hypothetical protein